MTNQNTHLGVRQENRGHVQNVSQVSVNRNQSTGNVNDSQKMSYTPPLLQSPKNERVSSKNSLVVLGLLMIIALVGGGVGFGYSQIVNMQSVDQGVLGVSDYNQDDYYAVFLSNGQVNFGKIVSKTDSEIILNDVYFLQVNSSAQPSTTLNEDGEEVGVQDQVPELSIIDRKNTLHSPTGDVVVPLGNVVFYEKLSPESDVLEAINNLRSEGTE